MLDNVVSLIACVSMNHQNQLEQMSNGAMFATDTLLSSVFGTRRPLLFRFLVFRMPTLRGVESIGNRLRVLASFWVPHLFLGLLVNSLV
jgi:hypothetical protein